MPKAEDFRRILTKYFQESEDAKQDSIILESGQVHRRVGGYPGGSHRMPVCCGVMRKLMQDGDKLLYAPPSGNGASLKIRYNIPRKLSTPETKQHIKPRVSSPTPIVTRKPVARIEPVKGKVVCFIPCCGSKNPSGTIKGSTDSSTIFPESISNRLTQARTQGGFVFDTDGPETTALELYTGSPYRTFAPIKHGLYKAIEAGVLRVYIVSAGYGVIDAREPTHNYNEQMKGKTATHWRNHGLQDMIAEILMIEKPDRFYGHFAAEPHWSHASSKYRYFFTEGGKKAISVGLNATEAGCFYRLDGRGVGAILDSLGRTFVDQFIVGFNPEFVTDIESNLRRDGNITIGFDRFR
jgi:hypothetical protein